MRLPILYTMSWPERVNCSEQTWPRLDFIKMGDLTFRRAGASRGLLRSVVCFLRDEHAGRSGAGRGWAGRDGAGLGGQGRFHRAGWGPGPDRVAWRLCGK